MSINTNNNIGVGSVRSSNAQEPKFVAQAKKPEPKKINQQTDRVTISAQGNEAKKINTPVEAPKAQSETTPPKGYSQSGKSGKSLVA